MHKYKVGDTVWFPIVGWSPPGVAVDSAIVAEVHDEPPGLYYRIHHEDALVYVWCGGTPDWEEDELYPDRQTAAEAVEKFVNNRVQAWKDALSRFKKKEEENA